MIPEPANRNETGRGIGAGPPRAIPRILLAEDDAEMRSLLCQSLGEAGYEVQTFADGLELMEYLSSYLRPSRHLDVDLIISDIRMPWVNGFEVLRILRQYVGYPRILLITAFGDEEVHSKASRLGAATVLDKPFDVDAFVTTVREIIAGHRPPGGPNV
jgi:DNA-binding response OmpR family regulator